jgi:hypothetical protein
MLENRKLTIYTGFRMAIGCRFFTGWSEKAAFKAGSKREAIDICFVKAEGHVLDK